MDSTTGGSPPASALRLLSLDGGGIRGLSVLVILGEVMHRIQRAEKLTSAPLPADYFDLICGTSTGGLIALLLGRLRLSVPEAIDKYRILAEQVFSTKKGRGKDGIFKASNLEKAIKVVVQEKLGLGHAEERMFATDGCKTFVCAVPAKHVNKEPRLFRTWEADKYPGYNCTIWEAGRATSAAPTLFKRIYIGDPGLQEEFIDAGMGCNNPVRHLIDEARREFGLVREVSCIVSIGTGKPGVAGFKAPGLFQRALPLDLIKVLVSIATDSEAEASAMETRYQHCPNLYHRLNVERGLEGVALEEWRKLGDVKTHTMAYLSRDDINTTVDKIVDALRGRPSQTFRLGQLDGTVQPSSHAPRHIIYPSHRVNHFVQRTHPEKEIRKHFQAPRSTPMPTVVVLLGMGGCGKSQLALEHCQQSENDKAYRAIFWIDATSPKTVEAHLTALARELSKPGFDAADIEGNVRYVLATISTWREPWLLVFDNFDDPHSFDKKSVKEYFPRSNSGSVLVTSRDRGARGLGHHIDVSSMSGEEALELLFRRSDNIKSDATLQDAQSIIKRLAFHALAIDQAGAYILARTLDFDLFLEHYDKHREEILKEIPELWDYKRKMEANQEGETKLTVFTTWELSLGLITGDETTRSDKEHILTLTAFFAGYEISDTLFEPFGSRHSSWMPSCTKDGAWNKFQFQDILQELRNLSLVQSLKIQRSGATFAVHPIVQDWMKLRLNYDSRRAYIAEATSVLADFIREHIFYKMSFDTRRITLIHLETLIQNSDEYSSQQDFMGDREMLDAASHFATFLESSGRYEAAEDLFRRTYDGSKRLLGEEHPDTLTTMSSLAGVLKDRGKYEQAEPLHRQAVALMEKILGKEHPDTLVGLSNLASLLESQGKDGEAEPLYRQTLMLKEMILGMEHPSTLTSINNLALLLNNRGKYSEAEPMYRRMIALSEKVLGKEHPDTLTSLSNLASLLENQGKYSEAEPMHRLSLALKEKILGKEHLSTLKSMDGLARLLESQGNYEEAKIMYQQSLTIREEILGKEHPDTLSSMNCIARLHWDQGQYSEAESIYQRTLKSMEKVFVGRKHPEMLTTMSNLASLLEIQGKYEMAEPLYRQTLALKKDVQGEKHPNTLICMNNLAGLLESRCKYDEATLIYRQTLALMEEVLRKNHPLTLTCMNNLAFLLKTQGKRDEAEALFSETLELREKAFGEEHPDTLISINNLASLLESQGRHDKAEPLYRQTLLCRVKVLGKEHPDTLISMNNLAGLLCSKGEYDEAERIYQQALESMDKVLGKEHPSMLTAMNNLTLLLKSQGKYSKAKPIYQQTITLSEKVLGREHPDTLTSIDNLASLLESQGKYDEAESLCQQAYALREKVLGMEHPSTLTSMNNLAGLLKSRGNYEEAASMYRQTLALMGKVLGADHPETLTGMNNLASLLDRQGKYSEAEIMYRQTLALKEETLGKEHPDMLISMNNLAFLLSSQGRYSEAEPMYWQTLTLMEKVLGKEHPDTLTSMSNLAFLLESQGRNEQAELMFQNSLALRDKVLGKEHPDTLSSMDNLAGLLKNQCRHGEAETMYRQTFAMRQKVLGKDHPDTLKSMKDLIGLLESQGKFDEARQLLVAEAYQSP